MQVSRRYRECKAVDSKGFRIERDASPGGYLQLDIIPLATIENMSRDKKEKSKP
jgi:hypothetical protein